MTQDHGQRAHATWSASSTDRSWNCPGSLALIASLNAPDEESEAAAWGTACHQISEDCLVNGRNPDEWTDRTVRTKEHVFVVDDEMAETAEVYVNYVREQVEKGDKWWVEQRFSLADLNPPFDAGGTADAVVYFAASKTLEVIDLKGGRGVSVAATGNPQLRTYALGAMLTFSDLKVDRVKTTIVQPRAPHKDGRIRSETFHVVDLVEWTTALVDAMRRAKMAETAFGGASMAAWAAEYLSAGDHCKFCRAKPTCPAIQQKVYDAAAVWFDDGAPKLANRPNDLGPDQLAEVLDVADLIEDWVKAVRAYAHTQAEMGVQIPQYVLVPKQGREKWTEAAESVVIGELDRIGVPESVYLNPGKLRTPKQVRDALKKAGVEFDTSTLTETPSTGTNLVRADKTSRKPAKSKADTFFSPL